MPHPADKYKISEKAEMERIIGQLTFKNALQDRQIQSHSRDRDDHIDSSRRLHDELDEKRAQIYQLTSQKALQDRRIQNLCRDRDYYFDVSRRLQDEHEEQRVEIYQLSKVIEMIGVEEEITYSAIRESHDRVIPFVENVLDKTIHVLSDTLYRCPPEENPDFGTLQEHLQVVAKASSMICEVKWDVPRDMSSFLVGRHRDLQSVDRGRLGLTERPDWWPSAQSNNNNGEKKAEAGARIGAKQDEKAAIGARAPARGKRDRDRDETIGPEVVGRGDNDGQAKRARNC